MHILHRVVPYSSKLTRTCICLFSLSLLLSYLLYCLLFSSEIVMLKASDPTQNCLRVRRDGGKKLIRKSLACTLSLDSIRNDISHGQGFILNTLRNNTVDSSWNNLGTVKFGNKKLPKAIIVGVKKGGTRAVLEFIRIHPDVRAVGTETHFFDRNYDRGLDWYR